MTGWNLDSAAWKRARREQWPAVQTDLEVGRVLRAGDIKVLKKYFLTGEADEEHVFRDPVISSFPFVFRVWLHPDRDQGTFDALRQGAHEFSLRYSDKFVAMLARKPPPSIDDIIKRLYDVFYLNSAGRIETFDPVSGRPTWFASSAVFPALDLLAMLGGWLLAERPPSHSIVRYLVSDITKMTESEWANEARNWEQVGWLEAVPKALTAVLQTPDDVRFETARTFASMLENAQLPSDLIAKMKARGVDS